MSFNFFGSDSTPKLRGATLVNEAAASARDSFLEMLPPDRLPVGVYDAVDQSCGRRGVDPRPALTNTFSR